VWRQRSRESRTQRRAQTKDAASSVNLGVYTQPCVQHPLAPAISEISRRRRRPVFVRQPPLRCARLRSP
jgi:hypothetical protein